MRTTLDIDEDVLYVVKGAAQQSGISIGRVLSDLARKALEPRSSPGERNGVPLFTPNRNAPGATLNTVNQLRDEE